MRPRHWRLLAAVVVALGWLMAPPSQIASAEPSEPHNIEPESGPPGTTSVMEGNPCPFELEPSFVWFTPLDSADEGQSLDNTTELRRSDGGRLSYVFVVPDVPAGRYELEANCPVPGGEVGPTVSFAVFTVVPDTATAPQPARGPIGGALLPALGALVGILAWHWRMGRGQLNGESGPDG